MVWPRNALTGDTMNKERFLIWLLSTIIISEVLAFLIIKMLGY